MADTDIATDTLVASSANTVTVEDIGPAKKRLTITIPAAALAAKLEESYGALMMNAVVPGFRKGKAPRGLLEKRFGESIRLETKSTLLGTAYTQALEEHKIRPVTEPEVDAATREAPLDPSKPLTFSVDVEVVPTFELPTVDGATINRPVIDVSEEHVAMELRRTQFRLGTPSRITGPFQAYDRMIARATVHKAGVEEAIFATDRALVVVPGPEDEGRGQILGLLFDDLQKRLEGKSVNEALVIETTGPEAHEREDIRGAKLSIALTFIDAERIAPLSVPELAERFGLSDEATLREQIKLALEQRRDLEQRAAMREQVYEHLLAAVDFPVPEQLNAAQLTRLIERQRIELLYRGIEPEQVETQLAAMRAGTEAQSRTRLKLFFILAAFAEQLAVQVTDQEVNGRVAAMARQRGQRPEVLRAEMANAGLLNEVALQIREHKTADRLLERCTLTDIPAEQWNEIVLEKQRAANAKGAGASAPAASTAATPAATPAAAPAASKKDPKPKKS